LQSAGEPTYNNSLNWARALEPDQKNHRLVNSSRTIVASGNNDKKIIIIMGKTEKMKGIRAQQKYGAKDSNRSIV